MTARQIEEASKRLHDLQAESIEDLVLAGAVFALALTASRLWPSLAVPLLIGAIAITFFGLRALVNRRFLVEDLAVEPDAYTIAAVRRFGAHAASLEHRRLIARSLRMILDGSTEEVGARVAALRPELMELIDALEDQDTPLDPQLAVTLDRRVHETPSPLQDPSVSVEELRARLRNLLARIER